MNLNAKTLILRYLILLPLAIVTISIVSCGEPTVMPTHANIDVVDFLSDDTTMGYTMADKPINFIFPEDHAAHESFKNEWWYFTGNLFDGDGRRFGYQLTFFRISISPLVITRESNWATNQLYMAHMAISDISENNFYYFEKLTRDSLGLAGFKDEGFAINVEDWSITGQDNGDFPWHLSAYLGRWITYAFAGICLFCSPVHN